MNKHTSLVILMPVMVLILLSCLCVGAATPSSSQTSLATVGATADNTVFTRVRLHRGEGDLSTLIAEEAGKAIAANRDPYLEFDATWCPACISIQNTLNAGDPGMVEAFAGTYIIQVDIDEWQDDLAGAGYRVNAVPIYYELDASGKPTGRTIDGGAWGENIAVNMAPPLHEFFQAGAD